MRDKKGPSEDPDNRKRRYTEQSREKARKRFTGGGVSRKMRGYFSAN